MRWDREVDVLVFGAGMGGMCAALVAACENLEVLLCEKTDQVGGTTATSAGTVWIPGSSQAARDSVPLRNSSSSEERATTSSRATHHSSPFPSG